jgi:hypothetical protein
VTYCVSGLPRYSLPKENDERLIARLVHSQATTVRANSTVSALGNYFSRHRSGDLGNPCPNFIKPRSRFGVLKFSFDSFDVLDIQVGPRLGGRCFDYADYDVLVLLQIQRLQGSQDTILVHGVDLERHVTILSRKLMGTETRLHFEET